MKPFGFTPRTKTPGLRGFVARSILDNPDVPSSLLHETAAARYPLLKNLSVRQFTDRYVLPVCDELTRRPLLQQAIPEDLLPRREAAADEADWTSVEEIEPLLERLLEELSAEESPVQNQGDLREELRVLFYRLALEIELAETRDEFVNIIAGIERYVEAVAQMMEGTEGSDTTS